MVSLTPLLHHPIPILVADLVDVLRQVGPGVEREEARCAVGRHPCRPGLYGPKRGSFLDAQPAIRGYRALFRPTQSEIAIVSQSARKASQLRFTAVVRHAAAP